MKRRNSASSIVALAAASYRMSYTSHAQRRMVSRHTSESCGLEIMTQSFSRNQSFPSSFRFCTQPSLMLPLERATYSDPAGTSSVTVEPAAT